MIINALTYCAAFSILFTIIIAQSTSSDSNLIPVEILKSLQPCQIPCVQSFIKAEFKPFTCGDPPSLDCLCSRYSNAGLALGDATAQCFYATCLRSPIPQGLSINDFCSGKIVSSVAIKVESGSSSSTSTSTKSRIRSSHSATAEAAGVTMTSRSFPGTLSLSGQESIESTLITATGSSTATPVLAQSITATGSSTPTPHAATLSTSQVAGISISVVCAAIIVFLASIYFIAKFRKRKSKRKRSPPEGPRFNSSEKDSSSTTSKKNANFSRGGGSRDLNPFSTAYPKMQTEHAGKRPAPNQIGVAISPEDDSPESMQSMSSVTGLLPSPPPKNLQIAPQRFQPQRRRPDSDMTQFEEDMQVGYPETQRRLSKQTPSPGGKRRSFASFFTFNQPGPPRSPGRNRPSPPRLSIPNDPRASQIPPSRPLRPPSDSSSIYLEPPGPTQPTFQIPERPTPPTQPSQNLANNHLHPQQPMNSNFLRPPGPPSSYTYNRKNPPNLKFIPPPQPSPAGSTFSNLPSGSCDYIPSYYTSKSPFITAPDPPVPSSVPYHSHLKPPSNKLVHRQSNASETSFESCYSNDSITPPDEKGTNEPPPLTNNTITTTTPASASASRQKSPLTPIEEAPATPVSVVRYPKIPRASNQAISRSPRSTTSFSSFSSSSNPQYIPPPPPQQQQQQQHQRQQIGEASSLLEKRRGTGRAQDLEKGLWITDSNIRPIAAASTASSTSTTISNHTKPPPLPRPPAPQLTSPPAPLPPPKHPPAFASAPPQTQNINTTPTLPQQKTTSLTSPPPFSSDLPLTTSRAATRYKPAPPATTSPSPRSFYTTNNTSRSETREHAPTATATSTPRTNSYASRGSSPTLPPPTPREESRTQRRVAKESDVAKARPYARPHPAAAAAASSQLAEQRQKPAQLHPTRASTAAAPQEAVARTMPTTSQVLSGALKSPLWEPRLFPRRHGGDLILEVSPR